MGFMKSPKQHLIRTIIKKKNKDISSPYVRLACNENLNNDCSSHHHAHHEGGGVKKGYVPLMVGNELGAKEKFMVRTCYMTHPSIVALLELSADEFGYGQEGVLQIPCDPYRFREIISNLSRNVYK
ncbi:hypothetical protein Droror1_Dr00019205 [Drosera rotundifolia]